MLSSPPREERDRGDSTHDRARPPSIDRRSSVRRSQVPARRSAGSRGLAGARRERYRPPVLAHFNHHEPDDRLPWPWVATIVVALVLAVAALALIAPDAIAPTI